MRSYLGPISAPLGPTLRQLRKARGLSLRQLADLVGTSESAIHRYESGWDRFEVRTLRRLAEALDAQLEIRLEPRLGVDDPRDVRDLVDRIAALFWDVELEPRHLAENPQWVLHRVLEFGDLQQNRWVRRYFGDEAIAVAARHRSMSPRVSRFWVLVLQEKGDTP
jgi:transcriptional regulator with XRE-family HTH domain